MSAIKLLAAHGIDLSPFQAPSKPLPSPYEGAKDKDKVIYLPSVKGSIYDYKDDKDFMTFWTAWPSSCRKGSPVEAFKAWKDKKPPLDLCLSVIAWKKKTDLWTNRDDKGKDYIKGPSVWINNGGWLEEKERGRGTGRGDGYVPTKEDMAF